MAMTRSRLTLEVLRTSKSVLLFLLRNSENKLTLVFPSSIVLIWVKMAWISYITG